MSLRRIFLGLCFTLIISLLAVTASASQDFTPHRAALQQAPVNGWNIVNKNNTLYAYNIATGTETMLGAAASCKWSPDRAWLQLQINENTDTLTRLSDGVALTITDHHSQRSRGIFPAWSPDGLSMVYEELSPAGTDTDIYLMSSTGAAPQPLVSLPDSEYQAKFSPLGDWVYFLSDAADTDTLYRIRPDGSELTPIFAAQGSNLRRFEISPNGEWIYYGINYADSRQTDVHMFHLTDGIDYLLDAAPNGSFFGAFSPDSQWVLYQLFSPNSVPPPDFMPTLYAARLDNSQHQTLADFAEATTLRFSADAQYVFMSRLGADAYIFRARLGDGAPAAQVTAGYPNLLLENAAGFWFRNEGDTTLYEFASRSGNPSLQFTMPNPQLSPDNRYFYWFQDNALYRLPTDGSQAQALTVGTVMGDKILSVTWSPNGQAVLVAGEQVVYKMPADGAQLEVIHETPADAFWSSDSQWVFIQADQLFQMSADGTVKNPLPAIQRGAVLLSPNGTWALIRHEGTPIRYSLFNLATLSPWNIGTPAIDLASLWGNSVTVDSQWAYNSQSLVIHMVITKPNDPAPIERYIQVFPNEQRVSELYLSNPLVGAELVQCDEP